METEYLATLPSAIRHFARERAGAIAYAFEGRETTFADFDRHTDRVAQALLAEEAPGVSALDPVSDFDSSTQIGAGWLTREESRREITWHNGQTGGFSTWFGLDRERGTAVFISAASDRPVDDAGRALLLEAGRDSHD